MAKFPTEVEHSVTVRAPMARVYGYLWDVVGSSACIPGLDRCERAGKDTYRFIYAERSAGPVSMTVRYTARYSGNGRDMITFEGTAAKGDNTDVRGTIQLAAAGSGKVRVTLRQMLAPDTPIPRLLQGMIRGFVEREAAAGLATYLENVAAALADTGG